MGVGDLDYLCTQKKRHIETQLKASLQLKLPLDTNNDKSKAASLRYAGARALVVLSLGMW